MPSSRVGGSGQAEFQRGGVAERVDPQRVRIVVAVDRGGRGQAARRERSRRGDRHDQHAGHDRQRGEVGDGAPAPGPPGDPADAERPFDEAIRDLGEHDRDREPHREEDHAVEPRPGRHEHPHRPVPEVQRIRAEPDRDEPRRAQRPRNRRGRLRHDDRHDDRAHDREHEKAAAIERERVVAGDAHRHEDRDERGDRDRGHRPRNRRAGVHPVGDHPPRLLGTGQDPQRHPDEQPHRVGIAPEVGARRVARGRHEHGHPHRRRDGTGQRHEGDARRVPADQAPRREHRERQHDVELLLDGQRPHVQEWRRSADAREVVALGVDQDPVRAVEERAERLRAEIVDLGAREAERGREQHHDRDGRECRQQPAGAARPEVAE